MSATNDRHLLRIVIVEDNYDANAGLARLLEKAGFSVAGRAYDGVAGLQAVKDAQPDVAILDIAMPALDGYELASRIRREMPTPPHLVAISGFGAESESETAAQQAGFEAYFRKPARFSELESLLVKYLTE